MITQDTIYNVKNRSSSVVVYKIPELNLRREFAPGETKRIPFGELEKLTYQQGGREMLEQFLQIGDEVVTSNLNVHREIEYDMSESQIRDLLLYGSLDAFLDALDFAPLGVIDLIKSLSITLPLTDLNKRRALKEKTGFDVFLTLKKREPKKASILSQLLKSAGSRPSQLRQVVVQLLTIKSSIKRQTNNGKGGVSSEYSFQHYLRPLSWKNYR